MHVLSERLIPDGELAGIRQGLVEHEAKLSALHLFGGDKRGVAVGHYGEAIQRNRIAPEHGIAHVGVVVAFDGAAGKAACGTSAPGIARELSALQGSHDRPCGVTVREDRRCRTAHVATEDGSCVATRGLDGTFVAQAVHRDGALAVGTSDDADVGRAADGASRVEHEVADSGSSAYDAEESGITLLRFDPQMRDGVPTAIEGADVGVGGCADRTERRELFSIRAGREGQEVGEVEVGRDDAVDAVQAAVHHSCKVRKLLGAGNLDVEVVDIGVALAQDLKVTLQDRVLVFAKCLVEFGLFIQRVERETKASVGDI